MNVSGKRGTWIEGCIREHIEALNPLLKSPNSSPLINRLRIPLGDWLLCLKTFCPLPWMIKFYTSERWRQWIMPTSYLRLTLLQHFAPMSGLWDSNVELFPYYKNLHFIMIVSNFVPSFSLSPSNESGTTALGKFGCWQNMINNVHNAIEENNEAKKYKSLEWIMLFKLMAKRTLSFDGRAKAV